MVNHPKNPATHINNIKNELQVAYRFILVFHIYALHDIPPINSFKKIWYNQLNLPALGGVFYGLYSRRIKKITTVVDP